MKLSKWKVAILAICGLIGVHILSLRHDQTTEAAAAPAATLHFPKRYAVRYGALACEPHQTVSDCDGQTCSRGIHSNEFGFIGEITTPDGTVLGHTWTRLSDGRMIMTNYDTGKVTVNQSPMPSLDLQNDTPMPSANCATPPN